MRRAFDFGGAKLQQWFPNHMGKGLEAMRRTLRDVDCVIEVHDARIPISGRNPILRMAFESRPHMVVLNKSDLIEVTQGQVDKIYDHYRQEGADEVVFTNCALDRKLNVHHSVTQIIPAAADLIRTSHRYNRAGDVDLQMMVVGIPNVGKSSLIKAIRKHYLHKTKGVDVAALPGHTKKVMHRIKVCDNPVLYLLDTPGIFQPRVPDMHVGMKLAICHTASSHVYDVEMVVDYLIFLLNQKKKFRYVKYFKLPGPVDNGKTVLALIAQNMNKYCLQRILTGIGPKSITVPDLKGVAEIFLSAYRSGKLGKCVLDDV